MIEEENQRPRNTLCGSIPTWVKVAGTVGLGLLLILAFVPRNNSNPPSEAAPPSPPTPPIQAAPLSQRTIDEASFLQCLTAKPAPSFREMEEKYGEMEWFLNAPASSSEYTFSCKDQKAISETVREIQRGKFGDYPICSEAQPSAFSFALLVNNIQKSGSFAEFQEMNCFEEWKEFQEEFDEELYEQVKNAYVSNLSYSLISKSNTFASPLTELHQLYVSKLAYKRIDDAYRERFSSNAKIRNAILLTAAVGIGLAITPFKKIYAYLRGQ